MEHVYIDLVPLTSKTNRHEITTIFTCSGASLEILHTKTFIHTFNNINMNSGYYALLIPHDLFMVYIKKSRFTIVSLI